MTVAPPPQDFPDGIELSPPTEDQLLDPEADEALTESQLSTDSDTAPPELPIPRQRVVRKRPARFFTEPRVFGFGGVVLVIGIWALLAALRVKPALLLPGPWDVAVAFKHYFTGPDSTALNDLTSSGQELLAGLLLAAGIGLPLGLLIGWYARVAYVLNPMINFLYATPRIALTPLLIIWLGITVSSRVAIVFLMALFPILINTAQGVQSLEQGAVRVARCFGGNDLQLFRTVALPSCVPFIISGLRLAVGQALIGVYVAELSGADYGVGMMMNTAGQQFQTSRVFAGLFIFAFTGVILTFILRRVERHFAAWRPATH